VADVAQLRGLNRAFVAQGLKVLAGRRNVGLAALIDAARLTKAPTRPTSALRWGRASMRRAGSARPISACGC
jgi:single-stranded DNA-specific DHH superfamily exonuclease